MIRAWEKNHKNIATNSTWERTARFSWKHLMVRCSSPGCSLRLNVHPALLARYRGIHFNNRWYHETACLREALAGQLKRILVSYAKGGSRAHRLPLGLLLVKRGAITPGELREGLRLQRRAGTGKLGYWLRQITTIDEDQICAALGQQWGCPVFPLHQQTSPPFLPDCPPYPLLVSAKAIPVFSTSEGRQWHIAFSERIEHTLLYGLEEILGCRTIPCVSRESAVNEALEQLRKSANGNEICFDSVRDAGEMATTICSYAAQMDIREVKVVRAGGYIWVAFFRRGARRDLLFRVPSVPEARGVEPLPAQIKAFPEAADMRGDGVFGAGGPL